MSNKSKRSSSKSNPPQDGIIVDPANGTKLDDKGTPPSSGAQVIGSDTKGALTKVATVGSTGVSPGFSVYRDDASGLLVLSLKPLNDDSLSPDSLFESSAPDALESWIRQFTVAYKRDYFPETKS